MNPIGLDGLAQFLGPGTGGLWMGEQQRNAMQESELNQQKTLEDLFKAKQQREHDAQMNPLRVQHQQGVNARQPVDLEGAVLGNQEKATKIKRQQYSDFLDDLSKMDPEVVGVADRAEFLNGIAQRNGIPVDHPMYAVALQAHAKGPEGWKKFREAVSVGGETRFKEEGAMARDTLQRNTQREIAAGNNRTQLEIANIRRDQALQVAKAKADAGKDAEGKKNYAQAFTAYVQAADAAEQAGDAQSAAQYRQRAQLMLEADAAVRGAAQNTPKAGGMQLTPDSGIQQRPPQPLPQVAPPQPQAPRQMTPQDQQALQWARSNPQDPRAQAILKKLGVQ